VVRQATPAERELLNGLVPMIEALALGRRPEDVALGCHTILWIIVGSTSLDEENGWRGRGICELRGKAYAAGTS
jgi:hypothetical protein